MRAQVQSTNTELLPHTNIISKVGDRPLTTKLRIATLNTNGLAKISKVYKLLQYFTANNLDFMAIQEMHQNRINEFPIISHRFIHQSGKRSNGTGIIIDPRRYSVIKKFCSDQLIAIDVRANGTNYEMTIVSAYINPTATRSRNNNKVLRRIEDIIKISIINQRPVVICGDWNNKTKHLNSLCNTYRLNKTRTSKTSTRSSREIDVIISNIKIDETVVDYNDQ